MRLVLATHNEHKRREFERMLAASPGGGAWSLEPLPADVVLPPEDGTTFAENAVVKARTAARATGRVSIADDSGITAMSLGGGPGVRSARYAGEHASDEENLEKLIRQVPVGDRLEYVCALAYVDPGGDVERIFEGRCTGRRADRPRGSGGFGYDPIFVPDEVPGGPAGQADGTPATMAELTASQKDAISHRGRAARALVEWLGAGGGATAGGGA